MANELFDLGMVGMGVMGRNLLLNMADHGFKVLGYNRSAEKIANLEKDATPGTTVKGTTSLEGLIQQLKVPRKVMLLVPAGEAVDEVIESLLPFLEKNDIIIDGGNSHYTDTLRRNNYLKEKGFYFIGVGVSGGEEGARTGPSIMPGGDKEAYGFVAPILEAVAAKVNGQACVAYLGNHAAGHYVKMVHNGIEYAIMQLISEVYDLLHHGLGLDNDELAELFNKWDKGDLNSYLIEITADIFQYQDDRTDARLLDMILDKAGAKGTGKWTSQDALDLPVPIPTIDMAVTMRNISSFKDDRVAAAKLYNTGKKKLDVNKEEFIGKIHDSLYLSILISYVQGLAMLQKASKALNMEIPMSDVVKVWRGGCIIRSSMLDIFARAFDNNKAISNLLLDTEIADIFKSKEGALRDLISKAVEQKIPIGALMSCISYYDAYLTAELPTNLIQAQRDYFGAHTYQRNDEVNGPFYHTEWMKVKL
ncbi:MAG: NADP-dependent phosphogluconate dehydrogenase [Chitinophagaceae bacterium]